MRLRVAGIAVVCLACLDPFDPPPGTVRFDPPGLYPEYWRAVQQCSGLVGDFARVRWFAVPETPFRCPAGRGSCSGLWREPHDIFVRRDAPYRIVGHEMLHDLLQRGDHPPVFQTCGLVLDSAMGGG